MKIALAYDPAGIVLRDAMIETITDLGMEFADYGMFDGDCRDYPVFGVRAANAVASGQCDMGIVLCGTGVGISMAAGKVRGIRCCCCSDCYSAKMTRLHNDANMLAMGGRVVAPELAKMIAQLFLTTPFEGGRHKTRIDMFDAIEKGQPIE